ncbi:CotH kinase family protein [Shewanella youngdeokensis]|uniref:CotH kinase family protein n=1 Tax=Shewanella youngdeokensis TaxID=2999068 RepID=A0ABZ0JV87_9GAMM|nr:CotH kinase family protein [Shewanella sp. DAU334]
MILKHLSRPNVPHSINLKPLCLSFGLSMVLMLSGCGSDSTESTEPIEEVVVEPIIDDPVTDDPIVDDPIVDDSDFIASDWTDETHSKNVDPNFSEVFDSTQVKRLDFVVTDARWQTMLDDMTALYGEFGRSNSTPDLADTDQNPVFVPAEVYYDDKQWYRVGIRFKGNSSLQTSWQQGILKLSFKLDFDEYEDDYPQIKNQRFYGFKKLSLKNNYDDNSLIREKVAADVFADSGMAVSHTAFYALYVDHGTGPLYFGLYTLVEEIDDTVLETQFADDSGNLYKPEDDGATFSIADFNEADFEKKTNEDEADFSDVNALYTALHDTSSDAATWRTNLEAVFDVDTFLKYLAVNGIIQNWDTYGNMPHNYYLYNNPDTNQLTWIPWDNNEALQDGKMQGALALDFAGLDADAWPLIANIIADDQYKARYDQYLAEVISGAFEVSAMWSLYDQYASLIAPYAADEVDGYSFLTHDGDFEQAITTLKAHASSRQTAVDNYLNQ